jgi:hypothetical protein
VIEDLDAHPESLAMVLPKGSSVLASIERNVSVLEAAPRDDPSDPLQEMLYRPLSLFNNSHAPAGAGANGRVGAASDSDSSNLLTLSPGFFVVLAGGLLLVSLVCFYCYAMCGWGKAPPAYKLERAANADKSTDGTRGRNVVLTAAYASGISSEAPPPAGESFARFESSSDLSKLGAPAPAPVASALAAPAGAPAPAGASPAGTASAAGASAGASARDPYSYEYYTDPDEPGEGGAVAVRKAEGGAAADEEGAYSYYSDYEGSAPAADEKVKGEGYAHADFM